jgi:uncharacterized protein (DUF2141 family)
MKFASVAFGAGLILASVLPAFAEDPAVGQMEEGTALPAPGLPEAPKPNVATVHVIAENIESAKGTVWLALCDASLSVDGCPYKKSVPASPGFVEITFDDVPPGHYAVVGYHDVNDSGEFDRLLGVPREPYALSAAAADMVVPTFDAAKVEIATGANDVIIRMGRLAL